jgi:nitroreductase
MAQRNWKMIMSDIGFLLIAIQDAALMTENMILAARSLGLGSCLLGNAPNIADRIAKQYNLPDRVFPLVQLVMGFPAEDPPPRPRYPLEFTLFEEKYPKLDGAAVKKAMKQMDEGYLAQDYYRRQSAKIQLEGSRKETHTYETYSWTEHISRKLGQWMTDAKELLEQLEKRGFYLTGKKKRAPK